MFCQAGTKDVEYIEVLKKKLKNTFLLKNIFMLWYEVLENNETEFAVNVLFSYLNKRTCEVQKLKKTYFHGNIP
jgi:hypothetical protein